MRGVRSRRVQFTLTVAAVALAGIIASATPAAADPVPLSERSTPSWQTNGQVRAVVIVGGTAYFGGQFTQVRSAAGALAVATRMNAAAIDVATGELLPWNPAPDGKVWAIAASPDGATIYLGGDFLNIGGLERKRLAAVDAVTGVARAGWQANAAARVRTILATSDRVYVGGKFKTLASRSRPHIAALVAANGAVVPDWAPVVSQHVEGTIDPSTGRPVACPPRCTPEVTSFELSPSGGLYLGGHFGKVNGVNRNNGAEVSLADGATLAWNPNVFQGAPTNPNQKNFIYGIALSDPASSHPDRVFICGDFWRVGGTASPNIGAVLTGTGQRDDHWRSATDGGTPACELGPGDNLYLGGHFRMVGGVIAPRDGVVRNHIAAVSAATPPYLPPDPSTGRPGCHCVFADPWDPGANSILGVHGLAASTDSLAAGGDFTRIGRRDQQGVGLFGP